MSLSYSSLERASPAPVTHCIFVGTRLLLKLSTCSLSLLPPLFSFSRLQSHQNTSTCEHHFFYSSNRTQNRGRRTLNAIIGRNPPGSPSAAYPLVTSLVTRAVNPLPDSTLTAISLAAPSPLTTCTELTLRVCVGVSEGVRNDTLKGRGILRLRCT
jgi:hypothetical protein